MRLFALAAVLGLLASASPPPAVPLNIEIKLAPDLAAEPVAGRMYVSLTRRGAPDETHVVNTDVQEFWSIPDSEYHLGMRDVVDSHGNTTTVPVRTYEERGPDRHRSVHLEAQVAPGDYVMYALLDVRPAANGPNWSSGPGNLYSAVSAVRITSDPRQIVMLTLTRRIP
jgi:hypothetical protein